MLYSNCKANQKKSIIFLSILFGFISVQATFQQSNNTSQPIITLGRYLFYDTRLSVNGTKSCGSCHDQNFAFTDNYRTSIGANGQNVKHNAPSLVNAIDKKYFTWANNTVTSLFKQIQFPLYNTHPIELGLAHNEQNVLALLTKDTLYQKLFHQSFPKEKNAITIKNIIASIVAFEKTIVSYNTPYDRYVKGNKQALNPSEKKGLALFFSTKTQCSNCHTGLNFTTENKKGFFRVMNDSLETNDGLYTLTKNKADIGKFKAPTLRNLLFTAPYWHDGSKATIVEAITAHSYTKSLSLPKKEKENIVAFLVSLTDSSILTNKKWSNPFNLIQ